VWPARVKYELRHFSRKPRKKKQQLLTDGHRWDKDNVKLALGERCGPEMVSSRNVFGDRLV
jgi:hypothetical protein